MGRPLCYIALVTFGIGLTRVSDSDLIALLRASHAGRLTFPVTKSGLMLCAFHDAADYAEILQGLDERGFRAALVVALAERRRDKGRA